MIFDSLQLLGGLVLLFVGGEFIVRGASSIATMAGMSKLLVGLTVVAFGTSAPEMAICLDAVWLGKSDIALGNIVGSNISNVLLILGLTALLYPIVIHRQIVQREVPIMIGISVVFWLLTIDEALNRIDGIVLAIGMIVFVIWQIRAEKRSSKTSNSTGEKANHESVSQVPRQVMVRSIVRSVVFLAAGVACLWFGAGWLVQGAANLAADFGVSKLVIGLTIVAVGSSAPEIATALMAAKRGQPELAVGSVIGSNIANLLLVGGVTALFARSIEVPPEAFQFDIPIMLVTSIACLPIFATGHCIDRWEGVFFLGCFAAFNLLLFIQPMLHESFPTWQQLVWPFVIPIILVTCLAVALHNYRFAKSSRATS